MINAVISVAGIEIGSTIMWVCVGVACAIATAMMSGGRRMLPYDLLIGVVAALAGGWASTMALGDATRLQFIVATLTALFLAGIALLVFNLLARHKG